MRETWRKCREVIGHYRLWLFLRLGFLNWVQLLIFTRMKTRETTHLLPLKVWHKGWRIVIKNLQSPFEQERKSQKLWLYPRKKGRELRFLTLFQISKWKLRGRRERDEAAYFRRSRVSRYYHSQKKSLFFFFVNHLQKLTMMRVAETL